MGMRGRPTARRRDLSSGVATYGAGSIASQTKWSLASSDTYSGIKGKAGPSSPPRLLYATNDVLRVKHPKLNVQYALT